MAGSLWKISTTVEFALFGEDYLRLKHLLEEDKSLMIKAKVQARYGKAEMQELKVTQMSLLSEAMDKMAKQLLVKIPLTNLNETLIKGVVKLVKSHKGDCRIRVSLMDIDENYKVDMHTGKYKVQASTVIRELKRLGGIAVSVIS